MGLVKLRHRSNKYKVFLRRAERYNQYKSDLAYAEYYDERQIPEISKDEEKLVLHKRKAKAEAKKLRTKKRRKN